MTRRLVLVHGRAQERERIHKDAVKLKGDWLRALGEGLAKSGLSLPIPESDVRFPFYGDTLYDLNSGLSAGDAAGVIVRGTASGAAEKQFLREVLSEVQAKTGITSEQIEAVAGTEVISKGPTNWEWVQGILRAIDRYVPYSSGAGIALATSDVYHYLTNDAVRLQIEDGVARALDDEGETIVVSHSLGTVVAYDLLRREGLRRGWKVPLFVTLGSPLGVTAIRKRLKSLATIRCPEGVGAWFNANEFWDAIAPWKSRGSGGS